MNENKPVVFMIMPFADEILALYDELKKAFGNEFEFTNAGDLDNQQNILKDIIAGIYQADVIIADLTGLNPNVFYELGIAHAMDKKVIILTQDLSELPFDIKSYRAVAYSLLFHKIPALMEELSKLLRGAVDGTVKYGSPVSDYAPNFFNGVETKTKNLMNTMTPLVKSFPEKVDILSDMDDVDEKNGYLDYIADITENTASITDELTSMSDEMKKMSASVDEATEEIERVKSQSGHTDASFVRNVCRKLAEPVSDYAGKLKTHTKKIEGNWRIVENSYLDLFDNSFMQKVENIEGLTGSLDALLGLQTSMKNSDVQIQDFIDVLKGSLGMERRLNKAISLLIGELEMYLTATDTMSSSIDRITSKGKIIINLIKQSVEETEI